MKRFCCAVTAFLIAAYAQAAPLAHGDLATFPTRDGVTQSLFIEAPSENPSMVVILYSGGDGITRLDQTGATSRRGNFIVRTAHFWVEHGYVAALTDAPSDLQNRGMDDYYRRSEDALTDQKFIIAQVRKRFPNSKIALVSTSRGTVTVGNVLQHAPELADEYVLTSPESVATRHPGIADLRVPKGYESRVLIVSNKNDVCPVAHYAGGKRLASRNDVAFISEESNEGGGDKEANCGGHSPHGFLGIERKTLEDINGWISERLQQ
ncbi:hypothetical protein [Burkholderia pseudomallei]|uniref:hypothetical protein n=1 Tax=Burkholderia pseudomallei TaxID=28450 RepID=UPI0005364C86|nr:hypothetical protein [Burkholderia pseudomallei]KGX30380.1 hypothetical protein Y043_317 [Burkholderia pseudomallei MSHR2138]KGX47789.1 hypothetical protein Y600_5928 [Burkholderia pseudomallei MSHR3709]